MLGAHKVQFPSYIPSSPAIAYRSLHFILTVWRAFLFLDILSCGATHVSTEGHRSGANSNTARLNGFEYICLIFGFIIENWIQQILWASNAASMQHYCSLFRRSRVQISDQRLAILCEDFRAFTRFLDNITGSYLKQAMTPSFHILYNSLLAI
jgi:hypothetical protein